MSSVHSVARNCRASPAGMRCAWAGSSTSKAVSWSSGCPLLHHLSAMNSPRRAASAQGARSHHLVHHYKNIFCEPSCSNRRQSLFHLSYFIQFVKVWVPSVLGGHTSKLQLQEPWCSWALTWCKACCSGFQLPSGPLGWPLRSNEDRWPFVTLNVQPLLGPFLNWNGVIWLTWKAPGRQRAVQGSNWYTETLPSGFGTGNEDKWLLWLMLQEDVCIKDGITSRDFWIRLHPYTKVWY